MIVIMQLCVVDTSHGRASDEVIINSDEEPSSSYSDDNDNDNDNDDRNNREHDGDYDDIHHNTVYQQQQASSSSSSTTAATSSSSSPMPLYIDLRVDTPILAGEEVFFPATPYFSNAYAYCYRGIWLHRNNSRMNLKLIIHHQQQQTTAWGQYGCPVMNTNDGDDDDIEMRFWLSREEGQLVVDERLLPCFRLYTLLHHGYYDNNNNTHDNNELNNTTNKKGVDMAVVINGRLSYKLELYAAKALLRSIQDYNAKNMIESSRRLQKGDDVSLLRDKSLLQIPVMEVREIEAGLLVQLIHTIQDYITIIDHHVYHNIGDDVNGDSGHVLSVSSYQDNGDDKTVDDDNNRSTKKGSNDSNKNKNNKPTK
ncbi:hypothetical protein FOZ60_011946 [Perkinsus olseni]|uniref:Uncharacterized protein n=1 Tax=Perkinsus olseni TaxID=32597 RepID=A0A7J6NF04_PEROL|nr:hypothetical protein FOZ60_011946 [Perkinsus olseni]